MNERRLEIRAYEDGLLRTVLLFVLILLGIWSTGCKPQVQPEPVPQAEPFPDRILIKIDPAEIADPFRPEPAICDVRGFIEAGILPDNIAINRIQYQGTNPDKSVAFSVHLAKPTTSENVDSAFAKAKGRPFLFVEGRTQVRGTATVAIDVQWKDLESDWPGLCKPDYFYLQDDSPLHRIFGNIGVVSMRRVFRSVEQPDERHPGFYTVRKLKDLLSLAKKLNPERARRAYRVLPDTKSNLVVPDNMENWFILRLGPGSDVSQALEMLENQHGVQKVSLDYPLQLAQLNDTEWDNQWGLQNTGANGGLAGFDINIEQAWNATAPLQPVVVAVIDTGFNENLIELENRLWTNSLESPNGEDDDCNGYIDDIHGITTYDRFAIDYSASPPCSVSPGGASTALEPHGTQVAAVIAAEANNSEGIAGTAGTDDVRLMNIALGTFSGRQFPPGWSEMAEAIWYAISPTFEIPDDGNPVNGADIVNMSFSSSPCNYLTTEAIYAAHDAGLILVSSAGNDDVRFTKTESLSIGVYPASLPGVIAVGGSSRDGFKWGLSNYGPGLDLVAPASEVVTLTHDQNNPAQTSTQVIQSEGTSYSSAYVSGGAAVILGRYPAMTAPYMRQWIRAKARDMLDPLDDGSNHVGDDEWTGAGMLDVGAATTALANPTDQPLVAEILIEKDWNYAGSMPPDRPFNVGGQPDLGIHVEGDSLKEWRLSYGLGDAPQTWIDIPVPDSVRFQQQPEPVLTYDSVYQNWDIETGHNYLDTDPLTNKEIYTLRLEAENLAGTTFTAYDWFVPARASIVFPLDNWTLVPGWGWIPITGYIDTRSAASAIVSVYNASNQLLWESSPLPQSPANHYNAYRPPPSPLPAVAGFDLVHNYGQWAGIPQFDPASTVLSSEGWIEYRLTVQSGARVDQDTVRVYVDDTHFNADYWPLFHEAVEYQGSSGTENLADYPLFAWDRYHDILQVNENGGTEPRLFLYTDKSVIALDGMGSLVWERRPWDAPRYPYSFDISQEMVIENVDGDGNREVLFSVNELQGGWKTRVLLLNAEDGTPYNGNWPVEYDKPRNLSAGNVALGDVMGDDDLEILFLEPRNFYYGIPEEDLAPAKLHVFDLNANELWVHEFAIEDQWIGPLEVIDLDGNGKDEIVLLSLGMVLQGNDTTLTGWESLGTGLQSTMLLQKVDGSTDVMLVDYGDVYLKSPSGVDRPGWPIEGSDAMVGQIVSGGDEEIVICSETLNVFDTTGNQAASFPEADLDGTCGGLEMVDVDQDDVDEIVVLVHRYKDNPAATERIGSFLEAFELDGTRLADGDDRWPIVLALQSFFDYPHSPRLNRQVAFGDVDGDGQVEVVQHLHIGPYGLELVDQAFAVPSAQIEVLHVE